MYGNYRVFDGHRLIEDTTKFIDAKLTLADLASYEGNLVFSDIEMEVPPLPVPQIEPEETEAGF